MSKKKTFMLRLSPELFAALEKWAADEFRSVNGQVEWILDRSLRANGRTAKTETASKSTTYSAKQKENADKKKNI